MKRELTNRGATYADVCSQVFGYELDDGYLLDDAYEYEPHFEDDNTVIECIYRNACYDRPAYPRSWDVAGG